jgi:hypothetical protein
MQDVKLSLAALCDAVKCDDVLLEMVGLMTTIAFSWSSPNARQQLLIAAA